MLELRLEFQLVKCIDILCYMHMIAVCDVSLIGNSGDDAETLLQAFRELVCRGLKRRSVKAEIDIML